MSIHLILVELAICSSLISIQFTKSKQTQIVNRDLLIVYVSLPPPEIKPEFNFTWIDGFTSRVQPVKQTHPISHLFITSADRATLQVILITNDVCNIATATNVLNEIFQNASMKDDCLLLTFVQEIIFSGDLFSNIFSIFNLTKPTFSTLIALVQSNLSTDGKIKTENFIQKLYTNKTKNLDAIIFLINDSLISHFNLFGYPHYEQTYSDGTGFNEAITLMNIPTTKQHTLQYHMLTNGIFTRIATFQQLNTGKSSLYLLLHHFFTDYFLSNDLFSNFYSQNIPDCIDSILCSDYQRSECEDDVLSELNTKQLEKVKWSKIAPFTEFIFEKNEPIVLTNTSMSDWNAIKKFTFENISNILTEKVYHDVKKTKSKLTFDLNYGDEKLSLNLTLPYQKVTLSNLELFPSFTQQSSHGHYLFTKVDSSILSYFSPSKMLYRTYNDWLSSKQFLWLSSSGLATHTHIDMDWNCFVQIRGQKRFTLFPPSQHLLMHMYPRVHPMWHKSRVDLDHFSEKFSAFRLTTPMQVTLNPGDLLFIPGYTWHYVESLTPSISLSTWSLDYELLNHMDAIYNHDHKFDLLYHKQGKIAALRLYIDMLINKMVGVGRTKQFLGQLISKRYSGLETLFTFYSKTTLCDPLKIPTAEHIIGYAQLDTQIISQHFLSLISTSRDILMMNYVEEISASVVGASHLYDFFTSCFSNQTYHLTDISQDDDFDIWTHIDN